MSRYFRQLRTGRSSRKALQDRLARQDVGEDTWREWQEASRQDRSFLWFGLAFILIFASAVLWLVLSGA